jgi:hypothetical protein
VTAPAVSPKWGGFDSGYKAPRWCQDSFVVVNATTDRVVQRLDTHKRAE